MRRGAVLRKFIAVFLVISLFFNMNTVAFGNIIGALEETKPSGSIEDSAMPSADDAKFYKEPDESDSEINGFAKLIIDFGIIEFMKIFAIVNMNEDIRYLCNRSVYMRIHDEWDTKIAKQALH
jgi:hypothetical protein